MSLSRISIKRLNTAALQFRAKKVSFNDIFSSMTHLTSHYPYKYVVSLHFTHAHCMTKEKPIPTGATQNHFINNIICSLSIYINEWQIIRLHLPVG